MQTQAPASPIFLTEDPSTSTLAEMNYAAAKGYYHSAHHPFHPTIRHHGLISYDRGHAVVAMTEDNEFILLSTTDRRNLPLEHRFRTPRGQIITMDEGKLTIAMKDRKIGCDILGNDNIYLGQFIQQVDCGNGNGEDSNYNHVLGIAAWKHTSEQLVHTALEQFSDFHRRDFLHSGTLIRHSPTMWSSREIIYIAEPVFGPFGQVFINPKEPVYNLRRIIAPSKGWSAPRLYEDNLNTKGGGFWSSLARIPMRPLVKGLSHVRNDLTLSQIEATIHNEFSSLSRHLRRGHSPYRASCSKAGAAAWIKGELCNAYARSVFGLNDISKNQFGWGVAFPTATGLAFNAIAAHRINTASLLGASAAIVAMGAGFGLIRMSKFLFSATRSNSVKSPFSKLIDRFRAQDGDERQIGGHFEMVNPAIVGNLRILDRYELNAISRLPSNQPQSAPIWNMLYQLNMQTGPYGTISKVFRVGAGQQVVVLSEEEKVKSGMRVEYWPQLDCAFAINPVGNQIPAGLAEDFKKAHHQIRMVWADLDENGHTVHSRRFIDRAEYLQLAEKLSRIPVDDRHGCESFCEESAKKKETSVAASLTFEAIREGMIGAREHWHH